MSDWTPVAKALARLRRVEAEEPGSMQHFAAALYLSDVITKLHVLAVVGLVEHSDQGSPARLSFELSRAPSTGVWVAALQEAVPRVRPFMLGDDITSQEWLRAFATWLTQRKRRSDQEALAQVGAPVAKLAHLLKGEAGEGAATDAVRTPLDLMATMVEIRNKTIGHHAYSGEFWATHVPTVTAAVQWIRLASPLWVLKLALPVERGGKRIVRILEGAEPVETVSADPPASLQSPPVPFCMLETIPVVSLGDLIWVDPATNLTYFANGSWRDSDSSMEFLCHSVEAAEPGGGSRRVELAAFAIRPPTLPASETEGEEMLFAEPGTVLNNLPPEVDGYVFRGALEERMRRHLLDSKRRHLINVRGSGGFGKTSLVLRLCHELAADEAQCPYEAIVWMSARDTDLTLSGAAPVRRAEESLGDAWARYASLFGETDTLAAREFFEDSLRGEAVLVVLDNFETFDDQEAAYAYLDELVEPPAKVIITSRHVFTGDSPVEVKGMSESEAERLLIQAARAAGVEALMTPRARLKIFEQCQGHPYAMKLVASQLKSDAGLTGLLTQVLRNEGLLDALFRRSLDDLKSDDDALFVFLLIGQFAGGLSEAALRVAVSSGEVDLDHAIGALRRRSLLEVGGKDGSARYDMPAMAREFARRHLAGHLLRTEVEATVAFLTRLPELIAGTVAQASEHIMRDLQTGALGPADRDRSLAALRALTPFEPAVWVAVARAERLSGSPPPVWEDAYKRAVEHAPQRADLLNEWSEATPDTDRKVELKVQAVAADPTGIAFASRVANFLNNLHARDRTRYLPLKWAALMGSVIDALEKSFQELDGEALSRLAWLYIHAGRETESRRVIERGLVIDFQNDSLRKLAAHAKLL